LVKPEAKHNRAFVRGFSLFPIYKTFARRDDEEQVATSWARRELLRGSKQEKHQYV
jgi:hypothetical protein